MILSPARARLGELTIEIVAPCDSAEKANESAKSHHSDEHNQADVDHPYGAGPTPSLFILLLLHLCTNDISPSGASSLLLCDSGAITRIELLLKGTI